MARLRLLCSAGSDGRFCAATVAELSPSLILRALDGVSFAKVKAGRVHEVATMLQEAHAGDTPRSLDELLELPGVGPKVAHLQLQIGWGETRGIAVDTHVHRIVGRLGWAGGAKTAEATRRQLERWLPHEHWRAINPLLVGFGQQVCAEQPACHACPLANARLCPQIGVRAD